MRRIRFCLIWTVFLVLLLTLISLTFRLDVLFLDADEHGLAVGEQGQGKFQYQQSESQSHQLQILYPWDEDHEAFTVNVNDNDADGVTFQPTFPWSDLSDPSTFTFTRLSNLASWLKSMFSCRLVISKQVEIPVFRVFCKLFAKINPNEIYLRPRCRPKTTSHPSNTPSTQPSQMPTSPPTISNMPSTDPSTAPTSAPTLSSIPSSVPSVSSMPSSTPSTPPTSLPSLDPTRAPRETKSRMPTMVPSVPPSTFPHITKTNKPTFHPTLHPTIPDGDGYIKCPRPGRPAKIIDDLIYKGFFDLERSQAGTLCTLTLQSLTNDNNIIIPLGRSYYHFNWETVAGTYTKSVAFACDDVTCRIEPPSKTDSNQIFVLTTFSDALDINIDSNSNSNKMNQSQSRRSILDKAVRFYEQSTFGITPSELKLYQTINDDSYENDDFDIPLIELFLEWTHQQMDNHITPMTSLRAVFRQQSSTRIQTVQSQPIGVPNHACDVNTRWHSYAFTQMDGHISNNNDGMLQVTLTSDSNYYLFSMNGIPRTEVTSIQLLPRNNDDESLALAVPGTYSICNVSNMEEFVGGRLELLVNGTCEGLQIGNPPIQFLSSHPNKPSYVFDLTPVVKNIIEQFLLPVPGTFTNDDFLLTAGVLNTHEDCANLPLEVYPDQVYLDFRNGTYLSFDARLNLGDNTLTNPLLSNLNGGGGAAAAQQCSNVPRTFLNEASCQLSTVPTACSNHPSNNHHKNNEDDAKIVVCGSPNEVSNDPTFGETGFSMYIHDTDTDDDNMDYINESHKAQKGVIWTQVALTAPDKLRQRMAWVLSQLFAISSEEEHNNINVNTESFLNYYDIFVRHAFGNFWDILNEVSYR